MGLFKLTGGHLVHSILLRDLEEFYQSTESFKRKMTPEFAVVLSELHRTHSNLRHLITKVVDFAEKARLSVIRLEAVDIYRSHLRLLESAKQG